MRAKYLVCILVLLVLTLPTSPAHAGGVVAVCDEAHLLAALAGGGTVTFTCSGTITLTATIVITADTTIDGSGQDVTISGNHSVRVFRVNSGVTLNLNELTVANGRADSDGGGGLSNNSGMVTVSNSSFSGNSATNEGGGIYNNGTLTVSNSTFSDNNSAGPWWARGGSISNAGTLVVNNSNFSGNSAVNTGGGIYSYNHGTLVVNDSIFSGNSATGGFGGGIATWESTLTVSGSTFTENSANGRGGGINSYGTLTVSNSIFSGNSATNGGGISDSGTVEVSNSTFSGNSATSDGGAIGHNFGGTLTVSNSTFSGNSATYGGGIHNYGTLTVSNSTLSGNSAGNSGGGIFSPDGSATLENTIVANSLTGGNCSGVIINGGGNLSYPDTTCPGINVDPVLGPLQNNGGPTETMAPGEGSAAIGAGIDAICAAPPVNGLDQRGVIRPQGAHCDIGAVEQVQKPSAVRLAALSAQSAPGTIPPTLVFGLLLVALISIGASRRGRQTE